MGRGGEIFSFIEKLKIIGIWLKISEKDLKKIWNREIWKYRNIDEKIRIIKIIGISVKENQNYRNIGKENQNYRNIDKETQNYRNIGRETQNYRNMCRENQNYRKPPHFPQRGKEFSLMKKRVIFFRNTFFLIPLICNSSYVDDLDTEIAKIFKSITNLIFVVFTIIFYFVLIYLFYFKRRSRTIDPET